MEFKFNEVHGKFMDYERSQINDYVNENRETLERLVTEKEMEVVQIHISDGNEPVGEIIPMNFKQYAFSRVSNEVIEIEKIQEPPL